MKSIILDIKARSSVTIRDYGEAAFAQHPDTEIVCITLKEPYAEPVYWMPPPFRGRGYEVISDRQLTKLLFTARFAALDVETEMYLWKYALPKWLPDLEFPGPECFCSLAARAALAGLPADLKELCKIFFIPYRHEPTDGHDIRTLLSSGKSAKMFGRNAVNTLLKFCFRSVCMEEAVAAYLPELSPNDQAAWRLNWKVNERGVYVPRRALGNKITLLRTRSEDCREQLAAIVGKSVAENREALLDFFRSNGVSLSGFSAGELTLAIRRQPEGRIREAVRIKKELVSWNLPEYEKFHRSVIPGNRVCGTQQFGRSFTGGWNDKAEVLTPLKLPRAPNGKILTKICFPDLDLRIADWLTGENLLDNGPYRSPLQRDLTASFIPDSLLRNKVLRTMERMLLYESPPAQFFLLPMYADHMQKELLIRKIMRKWQRQHPKTSSWRDDIFRQAVSLTGTGEYQISCGRLILVKLGKFLQITLPSGRTLRYCNPNLTEVVDSRGRTAVRLVVQGVISRQWKRRNVFGGVFLKDAVHALKYDILLDCASQAETKGGRVVRVTSDGLILETEHPLPKHLYETPPRWAKEIPILIQQKEIH